MPIQTRPAPTPIPSVHNQDHQSHHDSHHQPSSSWNNQVHGNALRLALGSILAPKRPTPSRTSTSSSGSATPVHSSSFGSSSSGSGYATPPLPPVPHSTPVTGVPTHPESTDQQQHSTQYLYPHHHQLSHHFQHHLQHLNHLHGHHPHTPSRLGIPDKDAHASSSSSPTDSGSPTSLHVPSVAEYSNPASSSPSPMMSRVPSATGAHAATPAQFNTSHPSPPYSTSHPSIPSSSYPPSATMGEVIAPVPIPVVEVTALPDGHVHPASAMGPNGTPPGSGAGTPKAKFIQTLQSKSAWDALIHGSFS